MTEEFKGSDLKKNPLPFVYGLLKSCGGVKGFTTLNPFRFIDKRGKGDERGGFERTERLMLTTSQEPGSSASLSSHLIINNPSEDER